ncbi:hypothetical protein E2C01_043258 [Portunus trituberculatus]|uniref:Uncharacterized protein n=1 Tax=Portunus trituberculatus TaxID=210409 RepID=A0A5B7FV86_PORTR|nr:hypothetical protein [Portunus trituberculatus]
MPNESAILLKEPLEIIGVTPVTPPQQLLQQPRHDPHSTSSGDFGAADGGRGTAGRERRAADGGRRGLPLAAM